MKTKHRVVRHPARFAGYRDMNGEFVSFTVSDEVFRRARRVGARVLLRLELKDTGELKGLFYSNSEGIDP